MEDKLAWLGVCMPLPVSSTAAEEEEEEEEKRSEGPTMTKVYRSVHPWGYCGDIDVYYIDDGERKKYRLNKRTDLARHAVGIDNKMCWGYGGSGPHQLGIAILADVTGDDQLAKRWYGSFTWDVIAQIEQNGFELSEETVWKWLRENGLLLEQEQ
jgi:Family of unknown function (DUF6166)